MRKILFNCSTNIVGGGIKNSAMFIRYSIADKDFEWHYAVSDPVMRLLQAWELDLPVEKVHLFIKSPARNSRSRKVLKELVAKERFSLVYTMAGPAYVRFNIPHLQGISNAYITHADWEAFSVYGNLIRSFRYLLKSFVQMMYSRSADYFVFQSEQARTAYCRRAFVTKQKTYIVPNAFDDSMISPEVHQRVKENPSFFILCPGADYSHKGFQFIPAIAREIKEELDHKTSFQFVLTLPDKSLWSRIDHEANRLGVAETVSNYGPFSYSDVNEIYNLADLVFVPSLLETFSATYLEAIAMRKPLVVADKGFAKEICGEYAEYVNPRASKETAKVLAAYINGKRLSTKDIEIGMTILNRFGNQDQRFKKIKNIIFSIIDKNT